MCCIRETIKNNSLLTWKDPVFSGLVLGASSVFLLSKALGLCSTCECTKAVLSALISPMFLWNLLYSVVYTLFLIGAALKLEQLFLRAKCEMCAGVRSMTGYTKPYLYRALVCVITLVRGIECPCCKVVCEYATKAKETVQANACEVKSTVTEKMVYETIVPVLRFDSFKTSALAWIAVVVCYYTLPFVVSMIISMFWFVLLAVVVAAFAYGKYHEVIDVKLDKLIADVKKVVCPEIEKLSKSANTACEKSVEKACELKDKAAPHAEKVKNVALNIKPKVEVVLTKLYDLLRALYEKLQPLAAKGVDAAKEKAAPHVAPLKEKMGPVIAKYDECVKPSLLKAKDVVEKTILAEEFEDLFALMADMELEVEKPTSKKSVTDVKAVKTAVAKISEMKAVVEQIVEKAVSDDDKTATPEESFEEEAAASGAETVALSTRNQTENSCKADSETEEPQSAQSQQYQ